MPFASIVKIFACADMRYSVRIFPYLLTIKKNRKFVFRVKAGRLEVRWQISP